MGCGGEMGLKLIAFDMDGTLTQEPSSWEYIHRRFGVWTGKAEAHMVHFLAGNITYEEFSILDAREWQGMPCAEIERVLSEIRYADCAQEAVDAARSLGASTALISSGISALARRVAGDLGIEHVFANELVSRDGVLTGEVVINVSIDEPDMTKEAVLRRLKIELGVGTDETWAVGDNWGDIGMLEQAGTAILVAPTSENREKVSAAVPNVVCVPSLCHVVRLVSELRTSTPGSSTG
ncbi:MAG: HAD-IB family phosphatase [Bacillota bacterium]|jgi:phosphoserine phosphatase